MGAEKFDELARLVEEARTQFNEFAGGKKIAAMRARKALQQIKKVAQDCRIEIQEIKKTPASGDSCPVQPSGDANAPS